MSCERFDNSLSEYTATVPAQNSTTINSSGKGANEAQINISIMWQKIAVRGSKNTNITIGIIANGTKYMPLVNNDEAIDAKMLNELIISKIKSRLPFV